MKEQILHLDPHDDYHSIRDKIGWVQTDRVLLVLPKRRARRLFSRQLDLLLIQRHADRLGAGLALVTDDPQVSDYADALGIQIFDKVDDSHLLPWRSRRPARPERQSKPFDPEDHAPLFTLPRPRWLQSPRLRLALGAFVFFNLIALITLMLALTLPGATITLTPQSQTLTVTVPITADPARSDVDATLGLIPAETIAVIVSGSAEVATTGVVDEATQRAGGTVTFTNLTGQAVRIPAGTAVRTTGGAPVRFVTQEDVTLEAQRNATGSAFVLALEPGPLGNVGAGLINSIEGPLAVQAAVINESATTGGEVQPVASVTPDDRRRVRELLLAQLKQQGYAKLLTQLDEGQFAPIDSVVIAAVLDEAYNHFAGEKAERLRLDMRIEVAATAVTEAPAFAVGQAALDARLGESLALIPGTATFARDQTVRVDEAGRVSFNVSGAAQASAVIRPEEVQAALAWQYAADAPALLAARFPVITQLSVAVWPEWFPRLPWLPWRINVIIQPSADSTLPSTNP